MFEQVKEFVVGPKIKRPDSFRNKAVLVVDLQYGYMCDMKSNERNGVSFKAVEKLLAWARGEKIEVVFLETRDRDKRSGTTIPYLIEPSEKTGVIEKWVPDGFENGRLFERLNRDKVRDLIVCGYAMEICVYETTKTARKLGFRVESSPDLIFGSKTAKPSLLKEVILADFYGNQVVMHKEVDAIIGKTAKNNQ